MCQQMTDSYVKYTPVPGICKESIVKDTVRTEDMIINRESALLLQLQYGNGCYQLGDTGNTEPVVGLYGKRIRE